MSYRNLDDQYSSPRRRYREVTKTFDRFDVDEVESVVAVHGTLRGENLQGVHFKDVRLIDRFEFIDGSITRRLVWNDLCATGVLDARSRDDVPPEFRAD